MSRRMGWALITLTAVMHAPDPMPRAAMRAVCRSCEMRLMMVYGGGGLQVTKERSVKSKAESVQLGGWEVCHYVNHWQPCTTSPFTYLRPRSVRVMPKANAASSSISAPQPRPKGDGLKRIIVMKHCTDASAIAHWNTALHDRDSHINRLYYHVRRYKVSLRNARARTNRQARND